MTCIRCGGNVSFNEAGLNRKLLRRDAVEFLCIGCLAKKLDVSESRLKEKIEEYRKAGCLLFTK